MTELRHDTPPRLAALVHSLLEKDPELRPPGALRVAHILQELASMLPALPASGDELPSSGAAPVSHLGDEPTAISLPRRPAVPRSGSAATASSGRLARLRARRLALGVSEGIVDDRDQVLERTGAAPGDGLVEHETPSPHR